jgi:glycosyltransferase involved in cell wall biosynthesis
MDAEVAPDVVRLPVRWLRRRINPFLDIPALADLYRLIRRHSIDIVHTHNAKDGILGRWAARLALVPGIVHTIHNVSFQASGSAFINRQYALQERWVARFTDRLLAVSGENIARYLQQGIGRPDQYRTIYSGLELDRYADDGRHPSERRAQLGLPDEPGPWIGWVGRFNPQKDPLTFVRAAQRVKNELPGAQFIVCGDDPLVPSLLDESRALAARLGLGPVMHFLGFRRDIATVFRSIDVLMHSSRYEGMGRVVCEALACERPVAGTAVDGVVEVIDSGRRGGILVPPGDPTALANAALRLVRDRTLAQSLAQSGRAWVVENLEAETMARGIGRVYLEVLHRRKRRPDIP